MVDKLIDELKAKYSDTIPFNVVALYVKRAFQLGISCNNKVLRFRRFRKEYIDKVSEFKYIPNPYNGGDDDFIVADMIKKEYTYGEYGSELFSDIVALNRDYHNSSLLELIKEQSCL